MTDTSNTGAAPAAPAQPILVNANPGKDGNEALLRQVLAALGLIAASFGLAKEAGWLNILANDAGPILNIVAGIGGLVGTGAIAWGQFKTRVLSKKAAAMANLLPDSVAQTK